jgi:hypothetical protein
MLRVACTLPSTAATGSPAEVNFAVIKDIAGPAMLLLFVAVVPAAAAGHCICLYIYAMTVVTLWKEV